MVAAEDPGDSTFDWDEAVEVSSRKDGLLLFSSTYPVFGYTCTLHQGALHMHIPQSLLRHAKPRSANASPQ